jgi:ATP-dependent DNA ligase
MHVKNPDKKTIKECPVFIYAFDIIYFDGYNLEKVPLRYRKKILKNAVDFKSLLRYLPHRNEKGQQYLQRACEKR